MSEPTRLHAYSGVSMSNEDIAAWMRTWAEQIEVNIEEPVRSLTIVAESEDGELAVISTGRPMDRTRVVGLLDMAKAFVRDTDPDERPGFLIPE